MNINLFLRADFGILLKNVLLTGLVEVCMPRKTMTTKDVDLKREIMLKSCRRYITLQSLLILCQNIILRQSISTEDCKD